MRACEREGERDRGTFCVIVCVFGIMANALPLLLTLVLCSCAGHMPSSVRACECLFICLLVYVCELAHAQSLVSLTRGAAAKRTPDARDRRATRRVVQQRVKFSNFSLSSALLLLLLLFCSSCAGV